MNKHISGQSLPWSLVFFLLNLLNLVRTRCIHSEYLATYDLQPTPTCKRIRYVKSDKLSRSIFPRHASSLPIEIPETAVSSSTKVPENEKMSVHHRCPSKPCLFEISPQPPPDENCLPNFDPCPRCSPLLLFLTCSWNKYPDDASART